MNGIDVAMLGAFSVSALIGVLRGFTKELLSLFNWGGAVTLSYAFLPIGRGFISPYIANPMMADGVALFCLFIISLVMLSIIANIIAGYIQESSFRGIDHSLGFGFGIIRGVVVISAAELIFSTFSPRHSQSPAIQSARFIPMARKGGDTLLQILPASLHATILEQATKVENQMKSKFQDHLKTAIPQEFGKEFTQGGGQGAQPSSSIHSSSVQPSPQAYPPTMPMQGSPQGYSPGGAPQMMQPQGGQGQLQMVVIRPSQQGQVPSLAAVPQGSIANSIGQDSPQGGSISTPMPVGLGQSAVPQDTQSTVDKLSRLEPQSSQTTDKGYTRGQRDDMNRLFQAADGE